ncbi:uncharacterized protein AMSG_01769 [Thecamonas trahens ATCC 50062]|uniref:Protein kinase domain-containing protein n=1 Tax=Thecamonas trahens ATCC 50062 TaxID=461836 RepID=A0A0L0DT24_THETB|nr:hypothetical protein AMSG_01769 [Thecamonas trahens ATCC 50062]KNC55504.1 hypothetical protein AMSG_01769 [Thecamonas trahens ATCC 50062]|eukprot:XP_013761284.1 hypothetical protein AMSG_01769 [Thecamonas trahens ATCC 50062]
MDATSIRGCFAVSAADGERISRAFAAALVEHGHVLDEDEAVLSELCELPLSYQGFVARLLLRFSSARSVEVDATLRHLFANVADITELFEFWETEAFSKNETRQLLRLLEQLCAENASVVASMQEWKDRLVGEHGEEDLATLFWDKLDDDEYDRHGGAHRLGLVDAGGSSWWLAGDGDEAGEAGASGAARARRHGATAYDYQLAHRREIDKYLHSIAVKRVYYPNYEKVVELGRSALGRETLGYDLNKDFEVHVLTIRLPCRSSSLIRKLCNRVEALRQLAFSPHFIDYRGADEDGIAEPAPGEEPFGPQGAVLHFFEHVPVAMRLTELVAKYGTLSGTQYVMRVWCRSLLTALMDILYMCTLRLAAVPTVHNVHIADDGLRILLFDLEWLSDRPQGKSYHTSLEDELVKAFGRMVFYMLTATDPINAADPHAMPSIPLEPFLRGILRCCLHTARRPRLVDLINHPFFHDAATFADADVAGEYRALIHRDGPPL